MSLTAEFLQATHSLRQVEADIRGIVPSRRVPAYPTLDNVLARFMPLPSDGLFLGVASDGLPVLLNMSDPRPGAMLVLGDLQSGKTDFLLGMARAATLTHPPRFMRFAAITSHPEEWTGLNGQPHSLGIWNPDAHGLKNLLSDLTSHAQLKSPETILLFIDDLQYVTELDNEIQENIFWLLANGVFGRVWTIASLDAALASSLPHWVKAFGTRIYGRVSDPVIGERLTPMPGANLRTLLSGAQFCIRERNHWLRFWLPLLN